MKKLMLLAGACALIGVASAAQAVVAYDANVTTGADGAYFDLTKGAMQVVTFNTPNISQTINSFTVFGIRYDAAQVAGNALIVEFYTGVDSSPGAADALATATLVDSVGYNLPAAAAGSYNFTLPGVAVTIPGNTVGVAAYFTNSTGSAYSGNAIGGRYSTGLPTVGSNDGFLYLDDDADFIFEGSERQQFTGVASGAAIASNIRMAMDVTVPEPMSLSALSALMLVARRRRA